MKTEKTRLVAIFAILVLSVFIIVANAFCLFEKDYEIIHLIGERHTNEECIQLKNQLQESAIQGNIVLAREGLYFNEDIKWFNVFGIEEKNIYHLSFALFYYNKFVLYKIFQEVILLDGDQQTDESKKLIDFLKDPEDGITGSDISKTLENISDLVLLSENLRSIYPNNKEILDIIFSEFDSEANFSAKIIEYAENHTFEKPFFLNLCNDTSKWINLLRDITDLHLQAALQKNLISQEKVDQFIASRMEFEKYIAIDAHEKINQVYSIMYDYNKIGSFWHDDVMINARNYEFLKNIITIFENNKYQQKPFYVIVGSLHSSFLYEELRRQGYKVELEKNGAEI